MNTRLDSFGRGSGHRAMISLGLQSLAILVTDIIELIDVQLNHIVVDLDKRKEIQATQMRICITSCRSYTKRVSLSMSVKRKVTVPEGNKVLP